MEEYAARTGKFHARILRCLVNSGQGESIPVSCPSPLREKVVIYRHQNNEYARLPGRYALVFCSF
jgi:hypothetical protein